MAQCKSARHFCFAQSETQPDPTQPTTPEGFGLGFWEGLMGEEPTLKQARSWDSPRAPFAFNVSMIHGVLQFTLVIAFCRGLHRCESRDIHC